MESYQTVAHCAAVQKQCSLKINQSNNKILRLSQDPNLSPPLSFSLNIVITFLDIPDFSIANIIMQKNKERIQNILYRRVIRLRINKLSSSAIPLF